MSSRDPAPTRSRPTPRGRHRVAKRALVIGALGVVFGDIGTSPLYTVQTIFDPGDPHPVAVSTSTVLGIISMIFWSVVIVVSITYVALVMRADNGGEGGILALITLIGRLSASGRRRTKLVLAGLGLFGASLFLGDSMITPAISVLSAVEGLKVASPSLGDLVVPITAGIIIALFVLQRVGTGAVGRLFGPVMIVWFVVIGACGVGGIAADPQILKALSPTYALDFFFNDFSVAFFALASVVLAVTGAEALYADMGHFGRSPITRAWLLLVFPACILSYMGQGALVLSDPANIASPFFLLVPAWGQWPLVILATAATVIASQAVITGAFSVAHQAVQLGYLPRLRIAHTSDETVGQIYVPWINWLLMVSVLTLVFTFESSSALAAAYGLAVTGTITITTLLFFYVARHQWDKPLWLVAGGAALLLTVDLLFLAATLTKVTHGAWLPLIIAVFAFTILTTWQRGRRLVTARREQQEGSLREFIDGLHERRHPVQRVPGTAVYLNRSRESTPLAMRATVDRLHALPRHIVILSIETQTVPHVAVGDRLTVDDLGYRDDGITYVTARFGYMDAPDIPQVLRSIEPGQCEFPIDVDEASYFLSTIALHRGDAPGLSRWRKQLFLATSRITADAAEYFGLPLDRTVVMGSRIEI
jgi:KUP system potassium uptake protein